jgi:hypothetical protein
MWLKSILSAVSLALFLGAGLAHAQVEGLGARVAVPDVPGGALVAGCYRADRDLYGPYRFSFCLKRTSTYAVRGENLQCDGALTWVTSGRNVTITLNRQACNRRVAWAAATITCSPRNSLDLILEEALGKRGKVGDKRMVVPDNPSVARLSCIYQPTVAGNRPIRFFAVRR